MVSHDWFILSSNIGPLLYTQILGCMSCLSIFYELLFWSYFIYTTWSIIAPENNFSSSLVFSKRITCTFVRCTLHRFFFFKEYAQHLYCSMFYINFISINLIKELISTSLYDRFERGASLYPSTMTQYIFYLFCRCTHAWIMMKLILIWSGISNALSFKKRAFSIQWLVNKSKYVCALYSHNDA